MKRQRIYLRIYLFFVIIKKSVKYFFIKNFLFKFVAQIKMYDNLYCTIMKNKSYLDSVESKAYRTFFKDGTLDMFFGLFLTGVGFNVLRLQFGKDTSNMITIAILLLIPLFIITRVYLIRTRVGYVKFSEKRRKRNIFALLAALLAQVVFGVLFWTAFSGNSENQFFDKLINPLTEFIFIVLIFSLIAYLIDYNRFYLIGLAAGTGFFLVDLIINQAVSVLIVSLSFHLTGIFLSVTGLILFLRFLKEYQITDLAVHDEKEKC